MQSRVLAPVILSFCFFSCAHQAPPAPEKCDTRVRALFDVGSGLSKVNVSEVESCPGGLRVKRVIDEKLEAPIPLEAQKNKRGNLSDKVQAQALVTLAKLRDKVLASVREKAPEHHSVEFVAVGTHAVRTAGNSEAFIKKFQKLGFALVPLSQQHEGEIAYRGVLTKGRPASCGSRQLVVWDAGGGSQQFTRQDASGSFHVVPVGFSSEAFREELVKMLGAKKASAICTNGVRSPNPIGANNFSRVEKIAREKSRQALNGFKIDAREQCLVGVGGLHTKSIEGKINELWGELSSCVCGSSECLHSPKRYTRSEVACVAKFLSEKYDCDPEIKGPFSPVTVSNGYMILGFLDSLATDEVHTMSVNMGHQLITDSGLPWSAIPISPAEEKQ